MICDFRQGDWRDVLAPEFERCMREAGRYVFSPIACVEPGRSVRIVGDGPAWTSWLVVAGAGSEPNSELKNV